MSPRRCRDVASRLEREKESREKCKLEGTWLYFGLVAREGRKNRTGHGRHFFTGRRNPPNPVSPWRIITRWSRLRLIRKIPHGANLSSITRERAFRSDDKILPRNDITDGDRSRPTFSSIHDVLLNFRRKPPNETIQPLVSFHDTETNFLTEDISCSVNNNNSFTKENFT